MKKNNDTPVLLRDVMDPEKHPSLPVFAIPAPSGEGLLIKAKGYGDSCSDNGGGHPILIEQANGVLRVVIWGDINQEDPTHIIELDGALESKREEDLS